MINPREVKINSTRFLDIVVEKPQTEAFEIKMEKGQGISIENKEDNNSNRKCQDRKIFNIGFPKTGTTSLNEALKILGFDYIEEAVSVIDPIIDEYEKYANKPGDDTYITSFCPSVNNLIQKYYTDLVKNIIPVASPSIHILKGPSSQTGSQSIPVLKLCGISPIPSSLSSYPV